MSNLWGVKFTHFLAEFMNPFRLLNRPSVVGLIILTLSQLMGLYT